MAQEAGDGLSLNEDRPDIDQPHGYDYRELQHVKKGLRIRLEKEHNCSAATMAVNSTGGEHLNGSAVAYEGSSAPTNRPDAATALANNAYDRGRIWIDDNYDPPVIKRWAGTAWEVLGRMLVDTESLVITLANEKEEDIDGGRETIIKFKGEKADGTAHELASIRVQHDGDADDKKGEIILYVNDGDDADGSLTEVARISSDKSVTFPGSMTVTGVITNSEAPVFTKGVVANDTYLQGRNSAGDGNVDMIKVGRNQADDTDVVQLPDKARTATDAAATENTQLINKKHFDDNIPKSFMNFCNTEVFNGNLAADDTWEDLDLSSTIGSNQALCFFRVRINNGGFDGYAMRTNGEADDVMSEIFNNNAASAGISYAYFGAGGAASVTLICKTDASGIIEHAIDASYASVTVVIDLIGYIK